MGKKCSIYLIHDVPAAKQSLSTAIQVGLEYSSNINSSNSNLPNPKTLMPESLFLARLNC